MNMAKGLSLRSARVIEQRYDNQLSLLINLAYGDITDMKKNVLLLSSLVTIIVAIVLVLNSYNKFHLIDNRADTGGLPDNYYQRGSINETTEGNKFL